MSDDYVSGLQGPPGDPAPTPAPPARRETTWADVALLAVLCAFVLGVILVLTQ